MAHSTGGAKRSFLDMDESIKLYIRDLRYPTAAKRSLSLRPWSTIKDVKNLLQQQLALPPASQNLYLGPTLLKNTRTLNDCGINTSSTLLLEISAPSTATKHVTSETAPTVENHVGFESLASTKLKKIILYANRGFALNLKPLETLDGSGGTYILRDAAKRNICVFKPSDEEPYTINNPRGFAPSPGITMRTGHTPGTGCYREVAAYLLDTGGVCGVPETTLANARHKNFSFGGHGDTCAGGGGGKGFHTVNSNNDTPSIPMKLGSLQAFVQSEATMDDLSPSVIPTHEAQKIAVLDLRLMNADRNAANLLARKRRTETGVTWTLTPIDHGYVLRTKADVAWCDWVWLEWPQMKEPLSKKLRQYVLSIDVDKDVEMLKDRLSIDDAACDVYRASCNLLISGVKKNLTLYEIATLACRTDDLGEQPSVLEKILFNAADLSVHAVENDRFSHRVASEAIINKLSKTNAADPNRPNSLNLNLNLNLTSPSALSSLSSSHSLNLQTNSSSPSLKAQPSMLSTSSDSDSAGDDLEDALPTTFDLPPKTPVKTPIDEDLFNFEETETPAETPDGPGGSELRKSPNSWVNEILSSQVPSPLVISIPSPLNRRRSQSTDSDASVSPGGFWHKRPTSPVKSLAGSFTEAEIMPSLSLDSPVRTSNTGNGVLKDVYVAHSHAKLRNSASASSFTSMAELNCVDDDDYEEIAIVSAAKALSFIDEREEEGAVPVPPPAADTSPLLPPPIKLVRSQSYSALNRASVTPTPTLGKEKEELVRVYFHKFCDLMLTNELAKITALKAAAD
mmetsp:Transcript_20707/g.38673  ORF Transcript_20707/g.38673 Transcript_20707/m.38673 type:complete len:795 (-) Transcript_20707:147-2531(-)|eukprot:CAMPEP_0182498210 /NCGR_PEP_ID=MMETSP1321-20130603/6472_1 /TAXON_ID=91990 /ORGANISM="Bolidomonas sp., Strain RCC1657" /LENGTH=794 /DNA_ID=CAMNT_0024702241 /DNA_START=412 /DNA_END=2796 /DNA_ORIENTATION=+